GQTSLSIAAQRGDVGVVRLLLETGKVDIDRKCSDGRTPISWALQNEHEEVVQLM
ncbi:hypothetical protein DM02DRAFT_475405, partial [Periconia macrospinosa]